MIRLIKYAVMLASILLSSIAGQELDNAKIEISPATPTAGDHISAKISGTWRNGCTPRNPQITKQDGNKFRINTSSPDGICTQALTRWSYVLDLNKLEAATYQVIVVNESSGRQVELGRRSFTVRR
ncbi:MAG: hypothetical protein J2P41_18160 [Blastocatellia bacterium]|nr:hypothetical protein [Blastocatellia bacterium]